VALQAENKQLNKQLKIVQEEREILKKATAYFASSQVRLHKVESATVQNYSHGKTI